MPEDNVSHINFKALNEKALSQPLVSHIYTADPSAHVFKGRIYIYPSHDIESDIAFNDNGDHFAMEDYHVLSMDSIDGPVTDHGVALHVRDIPWAHKQLWAPDAAEKNGRYYLFFPARNSTGFFQIGVAVSDMPHGPFTARPEPIKGSYSIDPAVFQDDDDAYYMYFGGIWGGQLQKYRKNRYNEAYELPKPEEPALLPQVAKMSKSLLEFEEEPRGVEILDSGGNLLLEGDNGRRFFEAAWVHKHNGKYYFSYSTGDTHFICYAVGDSPYGPFVYSGRLLNPVVGWTSHHSICKVRDSWYLFYHDSSLSRGITHLRSVKLAKITHRADGSIVTLDPYSDFNL
ncbi:MAG: glycoside hydrolase family 43 protein [Bacteroidota bacterium]